MNSLSCVLNILWLIDLSLTLFNTSWRIYSIPKKSKYTAKLLSINNETQRVPLLFLSSRSFVLGKLFLKKVPLNLGPYLK